MSTKKKNLVRLFSSNVLIKPFWFLYTYAIIRVLGKTDFGTFTLLLAVVTILTQIMDVGLVNRTYVLLNDKKVSGSFRSKSISSILIAFRLWGSIIIGILCILAIIFLPSNLSLIILFGCILFIGMYITQQCRVIFRSLEFFNLEAISIVIERLLVILLSIDLFFKGSNFDEYLIRYSLSYLLFLVIIMAFYYKYIGVFSLSISKDDFMHLLRQGGSMYINNIILSIRQRAPYFILERIGGRAIVGLYSSAYRFVESYMFIPNSIVQVSYAKFSRDSNQEVILRNDIFKTHVFIVTITLFAVSLGYLLMPTVVKYILGNEFVAYTNDYRLALLIFIPNGSYYLWTSITNVLHIQHKVNKLYVFNFSILIITQIVFYNLYGLKGAIFSMILSEFVMLLEYHIAISSKISVKKNQIIDLVLFGLCMAVSLITIY